MAGNTCDVCRSENNIVGVFSSGLGPISWCFCKRCSQENAEPAVMFKYLYEDVSNEGEGLREEINDFKTFIDGKYLTWKEYVEFRKS